MNAPRTFAEKAIRMRERVIDLKRSNRNDMECWLAIKCIKPWLDAYPNATPQQVARHLKRHYNAVQCLLPGGDAPNALAMQQEFHAILNTYVHSNDYAHA